MLDFCISKWTGYCITCCAPYANMRPWEIRKFHLQLSPGAQGAVEEWALCHPGGQQCFITLLTEDQSLHTLLIRHQGPICAAKPGERPHPGPSHCHTCRPTHGAHTEITAMNDEPLAFKLQGQKSHSQPTCHLNNAELEGKGTKKQVLEPEWIYLRVRALQTYLLSFSQHRISSVGWF